jgi:hypothetical protein
VRLGEARGNKAMLGHVRLGDARLSEVMLGHFG